MPLSANEKGIIVDHYLGILPISHRDVQILPIGAILFWKAMDQGPSSICQIKNEIFDATRDVSKVINHVKPSDGIENVIIVRLLTLVDSPAWSRPPFPTMQCSGTYF